MSLRMRLVLSFTLVVVLCLSIAAVSATIVLQTGRDRLSIAHLNDIARPIYVQVASLARQQRPRSEVIDTLQEQATENDIYILFTDSQGRTVLQVSPAPGTDRQRITIPQDELPSGSTNEQGTFTAPDGQTYLFTAYPMSSLFNYQAQSQLATLILAVPRSRPVVILAGLLAPFLWAGLIALVISVIIAVLVANSAYKPVHRVTAAVDTIAQGQYDLEVPVTGPKEIRSLATHFNEMVVKVKESQQQLRHFVADVSHQLRTPLTSIQGFAEAIIDGTAADEETRLRAAHVIDDESKRMVRQVEELLELSRLQSGQLKMKTGLVDVKELLLHSREVFSLRAGEKNISLRADIEPLVPVTGDVDRLEQVFSNLLDNALKNTPARGEVVITGRNIDSGGVEIAVTDTGPGIPPEQLPHVFERFYQAGSLRTGYGLGLAIAREIVTAHGGRIEAGSSPGEGTTFTVILPAGRTL